MPRIVLFGQNPIATFQVDCQRVDGRVVLEVYVQWELRAPRPPLPIGSAEPLPVVSYAVDGTWKGGRTWAHSEYDPWLVGAFAPATQARDLIRALSAGASVLEVQIEYDGDLQTHYFRTHGFSKAYEPVRARCG